MYRYTEGQHISEEDFEFPTGIKLDQNNRWVILAKLIPWQKFEAEYAAVFDEKMGAPAKSFRIALGSLIIQKAMQTTDREIIEQIKENPYLQYFLGMECYEYKAPFNSSTLVYFRKRIKREIIEKINREIVKEIYFSEEQIENLKEEEKKEKEEIKNEGALLLDATCTPSDITYPTDLGLLNQARKKTEKYIDILYKPLKGKLEKKPRTDRKQARKSYLAVAKKRKVTEKKRRQAIKQQLKYIKKNLEHLENLIEKGSSLNLLTKKQNKDLLVIKKIYEQQLIMYKEKKKSIENRIVSISQPYIRPIVRGKAGKSVEFGAKVSVSCWDGYVFLDHLSWDNFNESTYLIEQVEKYREYTGCYPKSIHVDKIYRTRDNRRYCKKKGIRMSGPKLGRPRKNISFDEKKLSLRDERIRNEIEGKFGIGKRKYGLNLIMTKLKETSETEIAMSFLVMNLMTLLLRVKRGLFSLFLSLQLILSFIYKIKLSFRKKIIRFLYAIRISNLYIKQAC